MKMVQCVVSNNIYTQRKTAKNGDQDDDYYSRGRVIDPEAKLAEMTEKLTIVERATATKEPAAKKEKDAPKVNKDGTPRRSEPLVAT